MKKGFPGLRQTRSYLGVEWGAGGLLRLSIASSLRNSSLQKPAAAAAAELLPDGGSDQTQCAHAQ